MVEFLDDAVGPSTICTGSERRAWKRMSNRVDLVDNYLCAGIRRGPFYTRQQHCLDRIDQSMLDRLYSSLSASWCSFVKFVEHDGQEALSDHIPITTTLVIKESFATTRRRGTYLKMDANILDDPEILRQVLTWTRGLNGS